MIPTPLPPFFFAGFVAPDPITDFPVGNMGGQRPNVAVYDITHGFVPLFLRNATTAFRFPGSIVKQMMALVAEEYFRPEWTTRQITITADDLADPYGLTGWSRSTLAEGDIATPEELMKLAFLNSCTTATQSLALTYDLDNSGIGDRAEFVAAMNAKSAQLGLSATTVWFDAFGGSGEDTPSVTRNVVTAEDMAKVAKAVHDNAVLRAISQIPSESIPVTGTNPRNVEAVHVDPFVTRTASNPIGAADGPPHPRYLTGKVGDWIVTGVTSYSGSYVWDTPSGVKLAIVTLGSVGTSGDAAAGYWSRIFDQMGMLDLTLLHFFDLYGAEAEPDPLWDDVVLLMGGDGSITDESDVGATISVTSVTADGAAIVGGSTASMVLNANTDQAVAPDHSSWTLGDNAFTYEMRYAGGGSAPGGGVEYALWNKIDSGAGNREHAFAYLDGVFRFFFSTNGSAWTNTVEYTLPAAARPVFYNGAPRHIAGTRSGNSSFAHLCGMKLPAVATLSGDAFNGTAAVGIGLNPFSISALGRFAEVRYTVGTARYPTGVVATDNVKFSRESEWSPAQLPGITTSLGSIAEARTYGRLWQNTGKTTPAVADGDPVRVASCPYTGIDWVAPSDAARPILTDMGSDTWALVGDGAQTVLVAADSFDLLQSGITAAYTPATFTNFDGLLSGNAATGDDLLLTGNNGSGAWFGTGTISAYRLNGVGQSEPYPAPVNDVPGVIVVTRSALADLTWQVGQDRTNSGRNWEGPIFAVVNVSSALSGGDLALLEAWLDSTIP